MNSVGIERFCFCGFMAVMLAAAVTAVSSEAGADWKDAANARIVRLHQREVRLRVVDEKGDPAAGMKIDIRQTRQAFPFGSAMSTALLRNQRYAEFFKAHFNWAVFGNESKWYSNESVKGREDYGAADALLAWCKANDIPVRGHCIFWEPERWQPRWVRDLSGAPLREAVERRLANAVAHFRGRYVHWDVDNEMLHGAFFKDRLGESIWPWMFKRTHELDPEAKLFVNEFNILSVDKDFEQVQTDEYVASIRRLLEQGAPIHGIGIQGHVWRENIVANPGVLKERLDKVAALDLPIWITEFDVADDDEKLCADKLEVVYRTAYSHAAVKGVMMWVFWAGDSWRGPNAGLARRDWTLNEAGKRYEALMDEWSTETSDTTDASGLLSFRGFHGDYAVAATRADGAELSASFKIEEGREPQQVKLQLQGASASGPASPAEPAAAPTVRAEASKLPFATPLRWKSTDALIAPVSDETHQIVSVKDPTVVRYGDKWHVYATTASTRGGWSMVCLSFADWAEAAQAKPYYIDSHPNLRGYHCAPQVFYFRPHKKWYLIYQSQHPQYSTTDDLSRPETWTKPADFFDGKPAGAPRLWIDYWVICDATHAYLFFTGDNGRVYRSRTGIAEFPKGMSDPEVVIEGPRNDVFEGSMTYKIKGTDTYLTLVEAMGPARYYRAWISDRLDGEWTPLPDANTWEKPFAGINNVTFADGVTPWTRDISHGELIRDGYDETLTIAPGNLQLLYQGRDPSINARYDQLPYRLALLKLDLPVGDRRGPTIKEAYKDRFLIGMAGDIPGNYSPEEMSLVKEHFGMVTPENCMKPALVHPGEDTWRFDRPDALVKWCAENDIAVHGHTLVWHAQTGNWFFRDGDKAAITRRMKDHIGTLVGRYKGKIRSWDVVNEAIDDRGNAQTAPTENLRNSQWLRAVGPEFLTLAFQFAHEADPDATLYYNDYGIEAGPKHASSMVLLKRLIADGAPVHGVGIQGHWSTASIPYAALEEAISDYASLGLKVSITELDVTIRGASGGQFGRGSGRRRFDGGSPATPEDLEAQAKAYARLFSIFLEHKDAVERVTFWGLSDRRTWRFGQHPLIFDSSNQRKPAYNAILDAVLHPSPDSKAPR